MRLLLIPILMFGISIACDRAYEEIMGIKIGCPLENEESYHKEILLEQVDENDEIIASIYHYVDHSMPELRYSDRNQIIVINGIVEYVEINNIVDPTELINSLNERWDNRIATNECEVFNLPTESDTDKEYCSSLERNIYVWQPSNGILDTVKLNYFIRSYQVTAISPLYQEISSIIRENR